MRVLVAGSSGLIGTTLVPRLRTEGHEVVRLVRRETRAADEFNWDPPAGRIDDGALDGVDAVVNLCGAPLVSGRWSGARKQLLTDSRLEPTEVLAEAVAERGIPVLINGSGVHFYGDTGDVEVDEGGAAGSGFLSGLCQAWEARTAPARTAGARVVTLRTAPVLSGKGGILGLLKPVFLLGLGAKLGEGNQYFSWISLPDHVEAIRFALEHDTVSGPLNLAAPTPVTNAEFTRTLGRALRRPAPWRAPGAVLRLALGEAADEMLLTGPRATSAALPRAGFSFANPELGGALAAVL
ncbi:TIGR01777 family protein [Prauserella marina]|uniref:Uncharacterized protein n=1 Tax=Prauserella marina TaxID=530584 RepID=A0A222VLN3_9PSEU|nr:TIGR01777 family oxidoreductase [Prauserella marina]ASR34836.1 TIGR01777 family protein [Prauserella marina]PWV85466.1 hypothetical protein DES30_1011493 [Prauserella marina]SDC54146.1 hypothetical protein SAMN05421630_102498 [Prauserella marina]